MDIAVQISLDIKAEFGKDVCIKSNATKEGTISILEDYLRSQLGKGRDDREPNKQSIFKVSIGVDLSDDSFVVQSDTGNAGLTTGVIVDALQRLRNNHIELQALT